MNRFTLIAVSAALLMSSCGAKKEQVQTEPTPAPVVEPTQTATPFTPNENGQTTLLQVKFWKLANSPLDSIAAAYAEQLSTKDTVAYKTSVEAFTTARESICKNSGISGGYEEYLWISQNIGNPINRPLLDSLNLQSM